MEQVSRTSGSTRSLNSQEGLNIGRPQICFHAWGLLPDKHDVPLQVGQTGFYLANDGIAAHEISIEDFEIEPGVWAGGASIPRIRENGEGFVFVWLRGYPGFADYTGKWDLQGAMAAAAARKPASAIPQTEYRVQVSAIYRDGRSVWYRSRADLIYIPTQNRLTFGPTTQESCGVRPGTEAPVPRDLMNDRPETAVETEAIPMASNPNSLETQDTAVPPSTTATNRRRHGPKRDYAKALKVDAVVTRLAPDGNWREHLENICDGLDENEIRFPKQWKKNGHMSWCDCFGGERHLVVKAIEHQLRLAQEHKKANTETFS